MRELGWTPLGVDLSSGMLRHARARLPTVRADAERLPIGDRSVDAVVSVLVHRSCWRSVRSSALQEPRTSTAPTVCSRTPARRTGRAVERVSGRRFVVRPVRRDRVAGADRAGAPCVRRRGSIRRTTIAPTVSTRIPPHASASACSGKPGRAE
ncbi:class I SAM-dependent methyltransferase [Amycolatopsis sp. A1MSW2902]|uniref:class I SAM-dependent methyltransferase n=1 Tax=Amycolatopsis sp. A1MSW2902 TaxID=687413 RepID=UPI00307E8D9D